MLLITNITNIESLIPRYAYARPLIINVPVRTGLRPFKSLKLPWNIRQLKQTS